MVRFTFVMIAPYSKFSQEIEKIGKRQEQGKAKARSTIPDDSPEDSICTIGYKSIAGFMRWLVAS